MPYSLPPRTTPLKPSPSAITMGRPRAADSFAVAPYLFRLGREVISQANQKRSPLLRLPAELRNKIYTLVSDTVLVERERRAVAHATYSGTVLRLVCRQTASEAAPCINQARILQLEHGVTPWDLISLNLRGDLNNLDSIQIALIRIATAQAMAADISVHRGRGYTDGWCSKHGKGLVNLPGVRRVEVLQDLRHRKVFWDDETSAEYLEFLAIVFDNKELDVVFHA